MSICCHRATGYARRKGIGPGLCGGPLRCNTPAPAYLVANRRANRMTVLVHDCIGVRLAARRLNSGEFVWPRDSALTSTLSRSQFDALVLCLP